MGVQGPALSAVPLPNTREAWNVYGLDQIWEMLCDEDGIDSFRQVTAWYRMAHLCTDQADQLEKALAQLMVKWPPNPGSAAEAFKFQVEDLVLSMRDSAAAAKANEEPLIRITSLISDAKDAILALRQQRAASAKAEAEWTAKAIVPFMAVPPSPVEPGWRDALDRQARDIMHTTDVAIGKAAAQFRAPAPFESRPGFEDHRSAGGTTPASDSRRVVPTPTLDAPARVGSGVSAEGPTLGAPEQSGDPILDGSLLSLRNDGQLAGSVPGSAFVDTPSGRVLAPGGVIGVTSGVNIEGTRVGSGESLGSARAGTTGMSGMMAPPIGRVTPAQAGHGAATRSGGRRRRRSDPDDSWVPSAGGPSVLEPAPEPDYFDPGPNVIGMDR